MDVLRSWIPDNLLFIDSTTTIMAYSYSLAFVLLCLLTLLWATTIICSSTSNSSNNKKSHHAVAAADALIWSNFVPRNIQNRWQQRRLKRHLRQLDGTSSSPAQKEGPPSAASNEDDENHTADINSSRNSNNNKSSWWEDFKPTPFRILLPEEEDESLFLDDNVEYDDPEVDPTERNADGGYLTHFCFLVHGYRGHSRDLGYVQHSMCRERKKYHYSPKTTRDNGDDNNGHQRQQQRQQRLIVHSVVCNEKKTDDGVANGGERLLDEMLSTIRKYMPPPRADDDGQQLQDITISMLGNSLGGLYARYALHLLEERCRRSSSKNPSNQTTADSTGMEKESSSSDEDYILDGAYRVYMNVFCTTATPHLGIAGHTFLPIPRTAEIGVAHAMGQSGKDLFRLNNLVKTMATSPEFLQPLARFRKRTAYANAYGTDFPVPAATAAFLHQSSSYPHHVVDDETTEDGEGDAEVQKNDVQEENIRLSSEFIDQEGVPEATTGGVTTANTTIDTATATTKFQNKSLVVATLHTPSVHECEKARGYYNSTNISHETPEGDDKSTGSSSSSSAVGSDIDQDAELAQMSTSLDALGWKKVFVDMRNEVPRVRIPKVGQALLRRNSGTGLSSNNDGSSSGENGSSVGEADDSTSLASDEPDTPRNGDIQQQPPQPTTASAVEPIHRFKGRGVVPSKDVAAAVLTTALPDEEMAFHWPMGHNMIVAFSRSRWSTYVNKAGRPVVDALAKELVQDIFAFERPVTAAAAAAAAAAPQESKK